MKIKLYQVAFESHQIPNHQAYWLNRPSNDSQIMRVVEVEVPDLPSQEYLDSFIEAKREERKNKEIKELKDRLAKLEGKE